MNTTIYQDVFSCVPSDLIHSRYDYISFLLLPFSLWLSYYDTLTQWMITCRLLLRQSISFWKERLGYTTIDLGIAPEKLESYHKGNIKQTDPMDRLKSVRGHLVSFPLDFMCKEDLRPVFNESEYYASPQVFH